MLIQKLAETSIPTKFGSFQLHLFRDDANRDHLAFVLGDVVGKDNVLTRVHSECFTGEVLGSLRCDCANQLEIALDSIARAGSGALVYLRQEGRGIGLLDKLRAYNLQDLGHDTVDANLLLGHAADERTYHVAAQILRDLQIQSIELLTNNPSKVNGLRDLGIKIRSRTGLLAARYPENNHYLETKARRMGHYIELEGLATREGETRHNGAKPTTQGLVDDVTRRSQRFKEIHGRPFVTLSYAQSLDGCLSARSGETLALSGPEALVLTHRLRAAHDAILVGIGTVLSDDPQLTVRRVAGRNPQPVVLDSQLRIPQDCKLVRGGAGRLKVAVVETSDASRREQLESSGIHVISISSTPDGMVDITKVLGRLAELGIGSVMVEGGVRVIRSFLEARLVDFLVVTVVPRFIGGEPSVRLETQLLAGPRMDQFSHFRLGNDLALYGAPVWAASAHA